ncbi:MAG: LysM peptidoglycan-binding domain-containing protein [Microscillaceae bacterium]|jgi:peptidoglycan endopeptidase LytF|nr:LysM peptidoglycan-binding domain-containing protein [Microscillaceae bacterium]
MNPTPSKHIVQVGESLYTIAKKYNLTVAELKQLNPLASSNLRVGQELTVTTATPPSVAPPEAGEHIVKAGDTLYSIAREYEVTVAHLLKLNHLTSHNLKIGQRLRIRDKSTESKTNQPEIHIVERGDSLHTIAQHYGMSVTELMTLNQLNMGTLSVGQKLKVNYKPQTKTETNTTPQNPDYEEYNVEKGESLYAIARKFGLSINELKIFNQLNSDMLRAGQILKIPTKKIMNYPAKNIENTTLPTENKSIEEDLQNADNQDISIKNIPQPAKLEDLAEVKTNGLPAQVRAIIEARKIFQIEATSGVEIFDTPLRGPVGRNHVNRPEDLAKVQARLIQLKMLAAEHQESPEILQKKYGSGAITSNYIPQTIEAIERFQNQFRVRFWIEHSSRVAMLQTNSFTPGVIIPNDVTYKVLREFTRYKLSFPHPQTQQAMSVQFENFPRSAATKYYLGVSYTGTANPEIPLNVFTRLGLNETLAKALKFVARNEGNFDAINTYDEGIFSYGFIQFAGNGGGFAPLMAAIKYKAPKLFEEFFQKYGIDVEYSVFDEAIRTAKMIVINPYDKGGKYIIEGLEAERVIRSDQQLYGVFIRAGHHLPIITLQIDSAIRAYVQPALQIKLNIIAGTLNLSNVAITDFVKSPLGLALLIDLTVNRWTSQTRDILRDAIEKIALRNKMVSEKELHQIDEKQILEQVLVDANLKRDEILIRRLQALLSSGLSSEKIK